MIIEVCLCVCRCVCACASEDFKDVQLTWAELTVVKKWLHGKTVFVGWNCMVGLVRWFMNG